MRVLIIIAFLLYLVVRNRDHVYTKLARAANQELEMARSSRCSGNEGRARVCARRAAGHVVGEYLTRNDIDLETESAS